MKKLLFVLDIEDDWPPIASEGVWCKSVGENFRLENSPFFISGLAFGDIFSAEPDNVNDHIFEFKLIEESGHSVVWLMNNNETDLSNFKEKVLELGCRIEGMLKFSLYSIDVPPKIDVEKFDNLIKKYENKGIHFAYPVWRLGE